MSDLEWDFLKGVLPNKIRGVKRVDDRRIINAIFYVLRTGIPWRDLPEQYGPYTTAYNRFNRWSQAGVWDAVMEAVADAHNVDAVMFDGICVRVHHSAATLKKRSTPLHGAITRRVKYEDTCPHQSRRLANSL